MQTILSVAIVALAAFVLFLVARSVGERARGRSARPARAALPASAALSAKAGARAKGSPPGDALVAVIAAAVCAASGMESGSFRIAGISASEGSDRRQAYPGQQGDSWSRGFNTPLWGHIDRNKRGE